MNKGIKLLLKLTVANRQKMATLKRGLTKPFSKESKPKRQYQIRNIFLQLSIHLI